MPKIKFDFFEVVLPKNTPHAFEHLIDMLDQSTDDESRTVVNYDQTLLRFQHGKKVGDVYIGEMLRIRMKQIPSKAKKSGKVTDFDLAEDEGAGEPTTFLFDPQTRTIVIQKSQTGVAPGAIRFYFEAKTNVTPMSFNPRLQKETMKKLSGMRRVKTLEVAVGSVTNASLLKGNVGSVGRALKEINNLGVPSVFIRIDAGRGKRSDLGASAKEEAHAMLALNADAPGAVQKLVITGDIEGIEKPDPLDLLEDKMIERVELPTPIGRGYSSYDMRQSILEAWERRKVEIQSMLDIGN